MAAGFVPVVYTYGLVLKYIYSTCVLVLTNESVTRLLIVTWWDTLTISEPFFERGSTFLAAASQIAMPSSFSMPSQPPRSIPKKTLTSNYARHVSEDLREFPQKSTIPFLKEKARKGPKQAPWYFH